MRLPKQHLKTKRINVFVPEETFNFLKALPGTLSEHFRRAISEYAVKELNASTSPTEVKREGDRQ